METPPAPTDKKSAFVLAWTVAHAVAWLIFVPIFCELSGGRDGMSFDPDMSAPPEYILLGFLLIALIEGLVETGLLAVFRRRWTLWLPASLVGGLIGGIVWLFLRMVGLFSKGDWLIPTGIVMLCVTLMQSLVLSIDSRRFYWWPIFKALSLPLLLPAGFIGWIVWLPIIGILTSLLPAASFYWSDFYLWGLDFSMGLMFGLMSAIGLSLTQNRRGERPIAPTTP